MKFVSAGFLSGSSDGRLAPAGTLDRHLVEDAQAMRHAVLAQDLLGHSNAGLVVEDSPVARVPERREERLDDEVVARRAVNVAAAALDRGDDAVKGTSWPVRARGSETCASAQGQALAAEERRVNVDLRDVWRGDALRDAEAADSGVAEYALDEEPEGRRRQRRGSEDGGGHVHQAERVVAVVCRGTAGRLGRRRTLGASPIWRWRTRTRFVFVARTTTSSPPDDRRLVPQDGRELAASDGEIPAMDHSVADRRRS